MYNDLLSLCRVSGMQTLPPDILPLVLDVLPLRCFITWIFHPMQWTIYPLWCYT